jgi:hypothetical protein
VRTAWRTRHPRTHFAEFGWSLTAWSTAASTAASVSDYAVCGASALVISSCPVMHPVAPR